MKRLLACLLAMAMVMSLVIAPAHDDHHGHVHAVEENQPAITVGTVTANPGEEVEIVLNIENNPGITYLNLRVDFGTAPVLLDKAYATDTVLSGFMFTTSQKSGTNPVTVMFDSGLMDSDASGKLAVIKAAVNEDAAPGRYEIVITMCEAYNTMFDDVIFEVVAGAIIVPCTAHDWVAGETTATCTEAGETVYTCSVCGETENRPAEALGHDFGEYVYNEDATCDTDGTETATCSRCDATDTRPVEGSHESVEHTFGDYIYNEDATCEEDGTKTRTCSVCGLEETVVAEGTALGHNFDEETTDHLATAADCCNKATYYHTCSNPGCDEVGETTFEHGEFDMNNHCGNEVVVGAKAPTEEETGYTGDTICDACGTVLVYGEVIPVLEHTHILVHTEAVAPTCTEDGVVEHWTCSKCGAMFSDAEGIYALETAVDPALGHSFTEYVYNEDAKCEVDGTETAVCDRCDVTDTRTAEGTALEHSFTEYVYNEDATCTEDGTKTAVCDHGCEKTHTVTAEGTALGHSFTEYVYNNDATCEEDGTETAVCDRCDETHTRTAEGTALGHADLIHTEAKEADCDEAGNVEHWTCATCGKHFADAEAKTELPAEEVEIPALGHAWGEWEVTAEPDCVTAGSQTRKCSTCDEVETEEIPALGHDYEEVVTAPTTEAEGFTTYTCKVCGHTYVGNYTPKLDPSNPPTGDEIFVMIGLMLASATGMAVLVLDKKKFLA